MRIGIMLAVSLTLLACGGGDPPPTDVAQAPATEGVNCTAFALAGDATSTNGATWSYQSTDGGIFHALTGVLYAPSGTGPFPGVVVSHGKGGSAGGYSSSIARTMRGWGMVAIATNYTHAVDSADAGLLPQGDDGASTANVQRAHKARELLGCLGSVNLRRMAAHGHSMGAFVTGELLGTYPDEFIAASHTAGGANDTGPNATRSATAARIRTPYQLHHGDEDVVVLLAQDQNLDAILTAQAVPHELRVYSGYTHEQMALDATMLERVRAWYQAHGLF